MFRIYHSKKFYIIDEFGKSIGSFNEKYYAELFVSLANSKAAQQSVQADGWRCPECDTVNADDVGLCESCGYSKSRRR